MRPCRPILTATDHNQLTAFATDEILASIADYESLAMLRAVLRQAKVVTNNAISPDVVTLGSECILRDVQTGEHVCYTLVFPDEADIARGHLSVLAPLGASLLGQSVNTTIRVPCPLGTRSLCIEQLAYPSCLPDTLV